MESKMTLDELLCSCCDSFRVDLWHPFLQSGYLVATDAHCIIAIPDDGSGFISYQYKDKPDVSKYLNAEGNEFMELDFELITTVHNDLVREYNKNDFTCVECGGVGHVEFEYNDKDDNTHYLTGECPVCHGEGVVEKTNLYNKKKYCLKTEVEFGLSIPRLSFIINAMRYFRKSKCMLLRHTDTSSVFPTYLIIEKEFKMAIMPVYLG